VSWTVLRVVDTGVVLRDLHARRFSGLGSRIELDFQRFCADATPGVYSLGVKENALVATRRDGSRLSDGMPTRFAVSPLAGHAGLVAKPPPEGIYAAVRAPGVCTLLTDPPRRELLEACSAAVVGWDGARFVLPPADRPRVDSTSEAAIRAHLPFVERTLSLDAAEPLAVANAVAGLVRVDVTGREPIPERARALLAAVFEALTSR
jgi:hypothetical protein